MPKVRELGITVLPEGFGPVGIGGGGCGFTQCSDCTTQPFSICGGTNCGRITMETCAWQTCTDCTHQPFSICGGTNCGRITRQNCAWQTCSDCTVQPFSICGTTPGPQPQQFQQCPGVSCEGCTIPGTGARPIDPNLTKAQIDQLKAQLKQQLDQVTELEKSLGPKTAAAIDARIKDIEAELEQLKGVRAGLKKK